MKCQSKITDCPDAATHELEGEKLCWFHAMNRNKHLRKLGVVWRYKRISEVPTKGRLINSGTPNGEPPVG